MLSKPAMAIRLVLPCVLLATLLTCNLGGTWTPLVGGSTAGGGTGGTTGSSTQTATNPNALAPGIITLHRLNRVEYNNTVHDLLNTQQTPANSLPADASSYGFDNIADALTVSDAEARVYQSAAESLANEATNPSGAEYSQLVTCSPTADANGCLLQSVTNFAYRAWRHPPAASDIAGVIESAQANAADFPTQLNSAVTAVLLAPDFLFRIELDPNADPTASHPLSDYELASRLSYFLWSSMPDAALFAAADGGTLHQPEVLVAQTHRMLADPKAAALADNFAGQWLELRQLANATPDPSIYPEWDETLRSAMLSESQAFFNAFVSPGAPAIPALLLADFTFINDRLADHYGYTRPNSSTVVRTPLPAGSPRGGVLTQGAWLASQAHPDRSGIVARGKFVLGQLLCASPPAPPPDVPALGNTVGFQGTQRDLLQAHVSNATCAACHNAMDPIGFAYEEFDGVGAQRTTDNGFPVDTTGTYISTGANFAGAASLGLMITADPRYVPCVVTNLFTYAMGRAPTGDDLTLINTLSQQLTASDSTFPTLIDLIVTSAAFRNRGTSPL